MSRLTAEQTIARQQLWIQCQRGAVTQFNRLCRADPKKYGTHERPKGSQERRTK